MRHLTSFYCCMFAIYCFVFLLWTPTKSKSRFLPQVELQERDEQTLCVLPDSGWTYHGHPAVKHLTLIVLEVTKMNTNILSSKPDVCGSDFLFFATASRPALGPTQLLIQCVPGTLSLGDVKLTILLQLELKLRMRGSIHPLPHTSSRCGA